MNDSRKTQHDNEDRQPTKLNEDARAARVESLLPAVTASDERDGRLFRADKRRRLQMPLTASELRGDLQETISALLSRLNEYEDSVLTVLTTPAYALDYCERSANYAIQDYPREFEDDSDITGLWDTLNDIFTAAQAWRKGAYKGDGTAVISAIQRVAENALRGIYPRLGTEDTE